MTKKYFSLFLMILISLTVFSEQIIIQINNSNDYNRIVNEHDSGYFYHIKEALPVIPSQKFYIEIDGKAVLKGIKFNEGNRTLLRDAVILSGENPLPLIMKPKERSVLKSVKSRLPESDYQIKIGYKDGKTIFYGYVSDFIYEDDILKKRSGELVIDYSIVKNPEIKNLSKSILIITLDSLKTKWEGYKDFYPDYDVSILSVNDILGLTSPQDTFVENIREYISYCYENQGLKGVILGADVDYIPGIYISLVITPALTEEDQILITDRYYSCIDGDWNFDGDSLYGEMEDSIDLFPDVLLGRVPARNSADVVNFLSKVAGFRNLDIDTFLGVASYLDAYTDGGLNIDNMITLIPITSPVKKLYQSLGNLSSASFINALNKSPMLVTHDGHGNYNVIQTGTDYTDNTDLDYLTNVNPIFMYSLSCLSAAYDKDCIAEHFLRSTGGGYYLGNSRYGWYTPYFPGFGTGDLLNGAFFKNIFNNTQNPVDALYRTFNEYSYEMNEKNDWRWQFFTLNYFGDPMVDIETAKPRSNIKIQEAIYKDGYFSMTMYVEDSAFVELSSDTVINTKVLYPCDNVFCTKIDNSDSIILRIKTPETVDFDTVLYTEENKAKSAYISSYEITEYKTDSLKLHIDFVTDSSDTYLLKPLSVTDTLLPVVQDTLIEISNPSDSAEYIYEIISQPLNSTMLSFIIGSDTLCLQYGRNLNESILFKAVPDKQHYSNGESGQFSISVKNKGLLKNMNVVFQSDTVLLDTFPNLSDVKFKRNFTVSSASAKAYFSFNVSGYNQSMIKQYVLSINDDSSYMDFEDGREMEVADGAASFHLSTNRSSSGDYSYYCGETYTPIYPPNYVTGIYSDTFLFDTTSFVGFDAYIDIESGMDYLVVYLYSGDLYVPVITLSGRQNAFKTYTFNASDYSILNGLNTRLAFEFYSEDDSYQYEGVYIDNILMPGALNSMGIHEKNIPSMYKGMQLNQEVSIKNGILFAEGFSADAKFDIFDLSGRTVSKGILRKGVTAVKLNVPNGKYFFRAVDSGTVFKKSFYILK